MSTSRILSAIGAFLIFIGGAAGIADIVGAKLALFITIIGGGINVFTERLTGGVSIPAVRAEAALDERKKEAERNG